MQVDLGISRLLFAASGQAVLRSNAGDPVQMARLANRYASEKLGLAPGREPGAYMPVYKTTERFVEEAVFETRDIVRTDDVFEERPVIETRDVYESRPVYEERAILETKVAGDRRLTRYDSLSEAGIDRRSAFSLTVGDGETAVVKFESSSRIAVTVAGVAEQFTFNSWNGSFLSGLRDALNSIEDLAASYSANGKLLLETSGGQSLTIADVAVGGWNPPDSPLDRLGLEEGLTVGEVVGYETVQTGTEQVVVGSEQVTVGAELVKIGEQSVITGSEAVRTGTVSRLDGYDHELIGLVEPEIYGTGVLGLLEQSGSGGLPANYIEALFGRIEVEEGVAARASETEARAAYDETDSLSDSDVKRTDAPAAAARLQPVTAKSSTDTQSL